MTGTGRAVAPRWLLGLAFAGLAAVVVALIATSWQNQRRAGAALVAQADGETDNAITEVDDFLRRLQPLGDELAQLALSRSLTADELKSRLCQFIAEHDRLSQIGWAYEPRAVPNNSGDPNGLFAPYCSRRNGRPVYGDVALEGGYDYRQDTEEARWYTRARRDGPGWSEPYFDKVTQFTLAEYTFPLRDEDGFAGVAYASYPLETLGEVVEQLDLGNRGYAILMSPEGRVIFHPRRDLVRRARTLSDIGAELRMPQMSEVQQWLTDEVRTKTEPVLTVAMVDRATDQTTRIRCRHLQSSGWPMCTVKVPTEDVNYRDLARRTRICGVGGGLALLLFAILLWSAARGGWVERALAALLYDHREPSHSATSADAGSSDPGPRPNAARAAARLRNRRLLLAVLACSGLGTAGLLVRGFLVHARAQDDVVWRADVAATTAVRQVDDTLHRLVSVGHELIDMATSGKDVDLLQQQLCDMVRRDPLINQVGWAYEPWANPRNGKGAAPKLFGPYCDGGLVPADVVESAPDYDYTKPGPATEWYRRAREQGPGWSEPYYDIPTQAMLAEFTMPFELVNPETGRNEFAGVVFVNYSLNTLADVVKDLDLGRSGYGFVFSPAGRIIFHPLKDYASEDKNLRDLANDTGARELGEIAQWAGGVGEGLVARSLSLTMKDVVSERDSCVHCRPLQTPDWRMCTVTTLQADLADPAQLRRERIRIAMSCIVFLITGLALLSSLRYGGIHGAWWLSLATGGVFVAGIGYVWHLALSPDLQDQQEQAIVSRAGVHSVEQRIAREAKSKHRIEPLLTVPTGVMLTSAEISSDNKVTLGGMIWLVVPKAADDTVPTPPPRLPSAVEVEMEPLYERPVGTGQVAHCWRFRGTMQQTFHPGRFPLDHNRVALDLVYGDFASNVLLVPDLASYDAITPSTLPGVGPDLQLPGWALEESYFSFAYNTYNADFGLSDQLNAVAVPQLRFGLTVHRVLLNPLISHVLPMVILLFLMFAVQLMTTRQELLVSRLGFNASASIGAYGAFFFVASLDHVSLRDRLATSELVYFEWVFILVYITLLALSLNSFLFCSEHCPRVIARNDNLLPKLLFWPFNTGALLIVTVAMFY